MTSALTGLPVRLPGGSVAPAATGQ
ncbi:MAG: hypothetical protein JWM25_251, partial [Thermoleophilia bacterium]|nr:hypothetical protein [Thermoleophilia bacterium]